MDDEPEIVDQDPLSLWVTLNMAGQEAILLFQPGKYFVANGLVLLRIESVADDKKITEGAEAGDIQ